MRIKHVVETIDISSGGPARSVTFLIRKIINQNNNISIDLHTKDSASPIISGFNHDKGQIIFYNKKVKFSSKTFFKGNEENKNTIVHIHGLWGLMLQKICRISFNNKLPYIITPRGMLEPWSLGQKKIKKFFAMFLYQRRNLDNSKCIHATSEMEAINLRKLGLKSPIAIIPNGINLDEFPNSYPQKETRKKKILFLSRIHKKKGIENLIFAWSDIIKQLKSNWVIEIIGNGEEEYINKLNILIQSKNLDSEITIKKPIFGKEKILKFREASLFVLPTYSENFGIVIAEALASYTPVITTEGAPWEELEVNNCGKWIKIGVDPLKEALIEMLKKDENELILMGKNSRNLVEKKYSMEAVASQMIDLYEWILEKGEKPKFII